MSVGDREVGGAIDTNGQLMVRCLTLPALMVSIRIDN